MEAMAKLTQKQLIAALKRLEKNWPKSHWLWVAGGVHLMRCNEDGEQVRISRYGDQSGQSVDDAYTVATFYFPADGGDW